MTLVVVAGDLYAEPLERRAIAHGSAAEAERSRRELQLVRRDGTRAVHEDLAAPRIDDGIGIRRRGRKRCERRHADAGKVERKPQAAGECEADPGAREAARSRSHDQSVEIRSAGPGRREQVVDVLEQRSREPDALAQDLAVAHERARRDVRRGVEGEDEHQEMPCSSAVSTEVSATRRASPPACSSTTSRRGGGSASAPASGHSTNTIASSKYGSRAPPPPPHIPAE